MYALLAVLHRRARDLAASWRAVLDGLRVCRRSAPGRRDEKLREDVAQLLLAAATARWSRGRWVSAERLARQASRAVSEVTHPHLVGIALNAVAGARLGRGDRRGAREALLRSLRIKERAGDLHQIAIAYSNLAEIEIALGEIPAALEHARRGVRMGEQIDAGSDLADMYKNLADASLAAGEIAEAISAGGQAFASARARGRVYLGAVAVTLARVCVGAARSGASDQGLRAAELARALLGSLATDFDDPDLRWKAEEARALLAQVVVAP
jgi:tetratricopeptide (TPR) repeat protein